MGQIKEEEEAWGYIVGVDAEEGVQRQDFKTDVSSIVAFVADNASVFLLVPLATSINALAIETSLAPRANPSALNSIFLSFNYVLL